MKINIGEGRCEWGDIILVSLSVSKATQLDYGIYNVCISRNELYTNFLDAVREKRSKFVEHMLCVQCD